MLDPILQGFSFGFLLSFLLGPSFFILLDTSLKRGVKPALILDLGVLWSDIIFIMVAYSFTQQLVSLQKHQDTLLIVCGAIFLVFGLIQMLKIKKKALITGNEIQVGKKDYLKYFIKGFVLNIINPGVLFYWFGLVLLGNKSGYSHSQMLAFFATILISFFAIDVLKILGAGRLKKVMNDDRLHLANRITGLILASIGLGMMVKGSWVFIF